MNVFDALLEQEIVLSKIYLCSLEARLKTPLVSNNFKYIMRPLIYFIIETEEAMGVGECLALEVPIYDDSFAKGEYLFLRELAIPRLLEFSKKRTEIKSLLSSLNLFKGHNYAKATVEAALIDIGLKANKLHISDLFGSRQREVFASCALGIMEDISEVVSHIKRDLENGYVAIKLKASRALLPKLKEVRSEYNEADFRIDFNGEFKDLDSAFNCLSSVDDLNFTFLDQPMPASYFIEHRRLNDLLKTPISLDESLTSYKLAQLAIELGACSYLCIKPQRLGGIISSLKAAELANSYGLKPWIGGLFNGPINSLINTALAASGNFLEIAEIPLRDRVLEPELLEGPTISANSLKIPDKIGLSSEGTLDALRNCASTFEVF